MMEEILKGFATDFPNKALKIGPFSFFPQLLGHVRRKSAHELA